MRIKKKQRRAVVWAMGLAAIGLVAFQGWMTVLNVAGIAIGFVLFDQLVKWERRGK